MSLNPDDLQLKIDILSSKIESEMKEISSLQFDLQMFKGDVVYLVEWVSGDCLATKGKMWTNKVLKDSVEAIAFFDSIHPSQCPTMRKVYEGY